MIVYIQKVFGKKENTIFCFLVHIFHRWVSSIVSQTVHGVMTERPYDLLLGSQEWRPSKRVLSVFVAHTKYVGVSLVAAYWPRSIDSPGP